MRIRFPGCVPMALAVAAILLGSAVASAQSPSDPTYTFTFAGTSYIQEYEQTSPYGQGSWVDIPTGPVVGHMTISFDSPAGPDVPFFSLEVDTPGGTPSDYLGAGGVLSVTAPGTLIYQDVAYHTYSNSGILIGDFNPNDIRDTLDILSGGFNLSHAYGYNSTDTGETINAQLHLVPEPSSLILVGLGLAGGYAIVRRHRRPH